MDDLTLPDTVLWHDKRVLYTLLDQPYLELDPDTYWAKPAVSEEGLGHGARRLECQSTYVVVPEATGRYVNVDRRGDTYHAWTAERRGKRFLWFRYLGIGYRYLTSGQVGKVEKLRPYAPRKWNMEFVGDTVLEAHARVSHELTPLIALAGETSDPVYCMPTWGTRAPDRAYSVKRLFDNEPEIYGMKRKALIYLPLKSDEEAAALAQDLWARARSFPKN